MDGEVLRLLYEKDWKSEGGGLNPKLENTRKLLTPGNINWQELTQKPALKPSSTQEPTSFTARHTKLILQLYRNIIPSIKIQVKIHTQPIDTSKLTTGHFISLQREEIQLHQPEHWHKLP